MSEADNDEFFDAEETLDQESNLIYQFREKLPKTMPSKADFSVWTFLKQCIGKELSKITMPIVFNEPISFLQRLSEYMEYSDLINKANCESNPVDRMEKISAFAVSVMASNWDRIGKPFNPLLGETYELHTENFKWISEQVSHHPPISAFYCESPTFKFYGSIHPKLKFWGKSVEITPKGTVTLELLPWKEAYTWQNVTCTVHNVIIGKIWIEHSGTMRIVSHSSNLISDINFHPVGWFGRNMHRVSGDIYYSQRKSRSVERKLYGKWTEALFALNIQQWDQSSGEINSTRKGSDLVSIEIQDQQQQVMKEELKPTDSLADLDSEVDDPLPLDIAPCDLGIPGQRLIWRAAPRPKDSSFYYNFTKYTMGLNQLMNGMNSIIAPTDSRLRRDMRLMEQGLIDEASQAKSELEEKQRSKRSKSNAANNNQMTSHQYSALNNKRSVNKEGPIWFVEQENPYTKKVQWIFTGKYWNRQWQTCPDIFL